MDVELETISPKAVVACFKTGVCLEDLTAIAVDACGSNATGTLKEC
jgi:hypothetical protein